MSKDLEKIEEAMKECADFMEDFEPTEENLKEAASMFDNVKIEECKDPCYMSLWLVILLFPFYFIVQEIQWMKRNKKYHIEDAFGIWFQFLLLLGCWVAIWVLLYHIFTNFTVAIVCASVVVAVLIFFVLPIYLINKYVAKKE